MAITGSLQPDWDAHFDAGYLHWLPSLHIISNPWSASTNRQPAGQRGLTIRPTRPYHQANEALPSDQQGLTIRPTRPYHQANEALPSGLTTRPTWPYQQTNEALPSDQRGLTIRPTGPYHQANEALPSGQWGLTIRPTRPYHQANEAVSTTATDLRVRSHLRAAPLSENVGLQSANSLHTVFEWPLQEAFSQTEMPTLKPVASTGCPACISLVIRAQPSPINNQLSNSQADGKTVQCFTSLI